MTGRLDPPEGYDAERRELWTQTVNRLTANGRVFQANPDVLNSYVQAVHAHRKATELVNQTQPLIIRNGQATENPAYAAQRRSAETIARLSSALGLGRNPTQTVLASSPMQGDGARWCEQHQRHECKHRRKNGEDCHSFHLITGTGSCRMHAGMRAADARRAGQVALARTYGSPVDVTPVQALLDEVRWSAGHVAALRQHVLALEAGEAEGATPGEAGTLWWGPTRRIRRPDGDEVVETAAQHVILQSYMQERRHFLEACRAAVAAGAQQELVDQAKLVGSSVGRLLDSVFERLNAVGGLTEEGRQALPQVVPEVIRGFDLTAASQ